jgi:fumarylacetoacetate (FAA) hydrolase
LKLATLRDGTRDGQLVVVSRDLSRMRAVPQIAGTLQAALDNWASSAPLLNAHYEELNAVKGQSAEFDPAKCAAPLPRAYQWLDASSYLNHVELVRRARGADMPASFYTDILMYQGASDDFLGPCDPILAETEDLGIDLEAEVVVVTDDVSRGVSAADALDHIILVALVNDVTLRNLVPTEIAKGFGFLQSKPASALSPVFVTPDELGSAWRGGKVHLPLEVSVNGKRIGAPNAGEDMQFHFGELVAHAARTRNLMAGTLVGSGTVSNRDERAGVCCLAEKRVREQLRDGESKTPFLKKGDRVAISMRDEGGRDVFGVIEQRVQILGQTEGRSQ